MSGSYPILDLPKEEIFELVYKQIEGYREIIEEGTLVDAKLEWLKSVKGVQIRSEDDSEYTEFIKSEIEDNPKAILSPIFSLMELVVNGNVNYDYMGFSGLPIARKIKVQFPEGRDAVIINPYSQGEIFMGCTHSRGLYIEVAETRTKWTKDVEDIGIEEYQEHVSKPYKYAPLVGGLDKAQNYMKSFKVTRQSSHSEREYELYFYYLLPHVRFTANGSRPYEMFFDMSDYCKQVYFRKKRYKADVLPSIECLATFRYRSAERVDSDTLEWWKEFELDEFREEFSEVWGGDGE